MRIEVLLLIISGTLLQFCASNKTVTSDEPSDLPVVGELLGSEYQTQKNESETHVLAWKKSGENKAILIKFAVYDLERKEIVYQGSALNGYVKWIDNSTIEKRSMPGIVNSENQANTVQININKKTKTPLGQKK